MKKNALIILFFVFLLNMPAIAQEKKKVAVIILEENVDRKPTNITETKLIKALTEKGFNVVESVFKDTEVDESLIDDNKRVIALAEKVEAKIVIIGKAYVEETKTNDENPISFTATIKVTAFAAPDMEVLGNSTAEAVSYSDDESKGGLEALKNASSEIADDLLKKLTDGK